MGFIEAIKTLNKTCEYHDCGVLMRQNCQSCFGEAYGRILELWAIKATDRCNFSILFCRSWGDDNAERCADAGSLDSDVSEGSKYSTGTFYLRIFVSG